MKSKIFYPLVIFLLAASSSCNVPSQGVPTVSPLAEESELTTVSETVTMTPTPIPPSPMPIPPPVIGPDNLDELTVLRNYWLQVSDALDPDFEIYGATSSVAYSPAGRFVAVAGCREVSA